MDVITNGICKIRNAKAVYHMVRIYHITKGSVGLPMRGWKILTALKLTPLNEISLSNDSVKMSPEDGTSVASD
jgi:hypothetical protein